MGKTRLIRNGKVVIEDRSPPRDTVSLHDANKQSLKIDRQRRLEARAAAKVAHTAIDAAFRPKTGRLARAQKPARAPVT